MNQYITICGREYVIESLRDSITSICRMYFSLCEFLKFFRIILFSRNRFREKNFCRNLFFLCRFEQLFVLIYYCKK